MIHFFTQQARIKVIHHNISGTPTYQHEYPLAVQSVEDTMRQSKHINNAYQSGKPALDSRNVQKW